MLQWLAALLRERDRFCVPPSRRRLPPCRVRAIREADIGACEQIYRLNEPTKFPEGYFEHFADWLRRREDLILVMEADGAVVALGGVFTYKHKYATRAGTAVLAFGMIHPDHQRRGLGTALLLARLSVLPRPDPDYAVVLSTTGGSDTFYRRFGFRNAGRFPGNKGHSFDWYRMRLYRKDWETCREMLREASVLLDVADAAVPSRPVPPGAAF